MAIGIVLGSGRDALALTSVNRDGRFDA